MKYQILIPTANMSKQLHINTLKLIPLSDVQGAISAIKKSEVITALRALNWRSSILVHLWFLASKLLLIPPYPLTCG